MNPTTLLTTIYFKILTNCPFLLEAVGDFFGGVGDFFANDVADFFTNLPQTILDGIQKGILTAVGWLLYMLTIAILRVFRVICSLFNVFSGIDNVTYKGEYTRLINVFFNNTYVDYIYKGMMIIGMVMCIGFTIAAVIRKTFDSNDKQEVPLGGIILNAMKAMLIMLIMTFAVTATISITNTLIQRVSLLFDYSMNGGGSNTIVFTDQDFAAMGRVYNTIGNYAVNPSYESRYNINSCFNEIRGELSDMEERGLFELNYVTRDSMGNEIDTWQSVLQKIVLAAPLDNNLSIDVYNPSVTNAILYAMDKLRNDPGFEPLKSYTLMSDVWGADVLDLDTVLFLMGTAEGALNSDYNIKPSVDDAIRGPFFTGEKSIYNPADVMESFNMEIGGISYITIIITSIAAIWQMALIILNCAQRIFSMLVMYLISPPIVAVMPFDNGAKFKQWVNAFVVQACGVLGQVVAMRVLMLFIPVVMSTELDLNLGGSLDALGAFNFVGKAILIICILISCRKVSDIINGILADNGGGAASQMENYLGGIIGNKGEGYAWNKMFGSKNDNGGGSGGGGDGGDDGKEKEDDKDTPDKANVLSIGGDKGGSEGGGGDDSQRSSTQQKKEFFDNMKKSESERSGDTVKQTEDVASHPIDSMSGKKGGNSSQSEGRNESKNESSIGSKPGGNKSDGNKNDGDKGGGNGGGNSGGGRHTPAIAPPTRNNSQKNPNLDPRIFGPSVKSGGNSGKVNGGTVNGGSVNNQSTLASGGSKSTSGGSGNSQKSLPDIYGFGKGSSGSTGSVNNQSTLASGGSKSMNGDSSNTQKPKFDIYGRNRVSGSNNGSISNQSTPASNGGSRLNGGSNGAGSEGTDNESLPSKNVGQSVSNSNNNGGGSAGNESGNSGPVVDINSSYDGGGVDGDNLSENNNKLYEDINANPYNDAPVDNGPVTDINEPYNADVPESNASIADINEPYNADVPESNASIANINEPFDTDMPDSNEPVADINEPVADINEPFDAYVPNSNASIADIDADYDFGTSDDGVPVADINEPFDAYVPNSNASIADIDASYDFGTPDNGAPIVENVGNGNGRSTGTSEQGHSREYMYRDPVKSNMPIDDNLNTSFSLEHGTKYNKDSEVVIDREVMDEIRLRNPRNSGNNQKPKK